MRIRNVICRRLKLLCSWLYCTLERLPIIAPVRRALRKGFKHLRLPKVSLFTNRITLKPMVGVLLAIIVLSALIIGLSGVFNVTKTFPGTGAVTAIGVGVYQDIACTVPVAEFNWGTLDPSSTKYVETYVRNEGNVPIKLSLYAVNWSPSNASSYIEFGWDYNNSVINAHEDNVLKVTFYLRVSGDVQDLTEFNFDIIIDAMKA